jgi:hypothetical protein
MKTTAFALGRRFSTAAATLGLIVHAQAATIFTDDFKAGASPSWGNESGFWVAAGGVYKATAPANFPATVSFLPFSLTDFSVDFDIQGVHDGGIWLRSSPAPGTSLGIKGISLNLKTVDGPPRIYWHIVADGTDYGVPLNVVPTAYGNNPHIHVEVSGNTYSAFVNGSRTAATTLTTSIFPNGRVALYEYSGQSFGNFVLQAAGEPTARVEARVQNTIRPTSSPLAPTAAPVPQATAQLSSSTAAEPPVLNIESGVVISWPARTTDYALEETTNLNTPNWTRVTNTISTVNKVVIKSPSGNKFYRLVSP